MSDLPKKESEKIYSSYLCSVTINCECEICGNYFTQEAQEIYKHMKGFILPCTCESCGRSANRVFLESAEGLIEKSPLDCPIRFPGDIFFTHFKDDSNKFSYSIREQFEKIKDLRPKYPREEIDWEKRNERLKAYVDTITSSDSSLISRVKDSDFGNVKTVPLKTYKRKIKF